MKNINFLSKVTVPLLIFALLFSCQQDEVIDTSSGVEFILTPAFMQEDGARMQQDEFPTVGEGMCNLIHAAYAAIAIEGVADEIILPIKQWGTNYKTNLVELAPGSYTMLNFVVYNDEDEAIFATPTQDSEFGPFVSEPLPIEFSVSLYEKSEQPVEVLCVENFTPPQFGFSFWNIGLKATKQLCVFGNYCETEFGHRVAEMEAWVFPNEQATTAADLIWRTISDPDDENTENNLLCLKFPYDPKMPTEDQSYYVILRLEDIFLAATLSLDDIDMINASEGYLHLNKNCENDFGPFQIADEITLPFNADFLGVYVYAGPDNTGICDFPRRVNVDVEGMGSPVGQFNGAFTFCAVPVKDGGYYDNVEAYMVDENGDRLNLTIINGQVIGGRTDDHPEDVTSYWRDQFIILGGTGIYEGATGGGYTDDFNNSTDKNSHHHWRGKITLVSGH